MPTTQLILMVSYGVKLSINCINYKLINFSGRALSSAAIFNETNVQIVPSQL